MRCRNCGEEMPDRALVCGKCGTPVRPEDMPPAAEPEETAETVEEQETAEAWNREEEEHNSNRIPYSADPVRAFRRAEEREIELTGREGYAKVGQLIAIFSICSLWFPLATVPLSMAAIILGFMGYRSAFSKQAVRAIVIGCIMLLTGMVLIIAAAMMLPYIDELMEVFSAAMP